MNNKRLNMRGDDVSSTGLLDLISILPNNIIMAEVGCYSGNSTLLFLKSGKIKTFYAIDPWSSVHEGGYDNVPKDKIKRRKEVYANMPFAEKLFDERIESFDNIIKLKMKFSDSINKLPILDFIYIDGMHEYEYVLEDIKLSKSIIKSGGIMAGHDYAPKFPGVIKAVNEMFDIQKIKLYKDSSWLIKI